MQAALQSQIKGFKKETLTSSGWSDDDEDTAPRPKAVAAPRPSATIAVRPAPPIDSDEVRTATQPFARPTSPIIV
jgi:hypothetical protein